MTLHLWYVTWDTIASPKKKHYKRESLLCLSGSTEDPYCSLASAFLQPLSGDVIFYFAHL